MPAPTSGLARVTIRAPRRRLDLAMPHQVPLAELLPEVLRRAGEAGPELDGAAAPAGGWILRRGDGGSLNGDTALAHQGVRDGDVLYLVPRNLTWPEPDYDDVIEEIAASAKQHGRDLGRGRHPPVRARRGRAWCCSPVSACWSRSDPIGSCRRWPPPASRAFCW